MENKALAYCAIAAVLGIISAVMGFAGEATRVKASEVLVDVDSSCIYPSSPALALGIVAAVFSIITRIYISVSFGGTCCRNDPNSTPVSKLFFVLSWVASVGAVILLMAAAALNNREGGEVDSDGFTTCYVVKPGIFAAGAILALLSAVFGIVAYISLSSTAQTSSSHPSIGLPAAHANVDLEKYPHQQYPPQQYPQPQQYPPQQYP